MIYSMTAFSVKEASEGEITVHSEIRSYNSRFLDLALKIPFGYHSLEEKIKRLVAEKITRGRIEIKITIRNNSPDGSRFEINLPRARAYYQALKDLEQELKLEKSLTLDLVLKPGEIITPCDVDENIAETAWPVLETCLKEALDALNQMRKKEGDFIAKDFENRMDFLQNCLEEIEARAKRLPELYQNRLKERITNLIQGITEIDPVRIAQEAAILGEKGDISEEITRAKSHIVQFRSLMKDREAAGRKLNFLLQEFNREFNTMGSKSGDVGLSHLIVDAKSEVEKIREQVQNIE
jgi:uncharacterized protein (TIGR00255 family)